MNAWKVKDKLSFFGCGIQSTYSISQPERVWSDEYAKVTADESLKWAKVTKVGKKGKNREKVKGQKDKDR